MKSAGINLGKAEKEELLKEIRQFFLKEREEDISEFQATLFADFVLERVGPYIYNQAIADAHRLISEKTEELFMLEKRPR